MIYDVLMRLPFTVWVVASALSQAAGMSGSMPPTHMAMRLSTIAFLVLLAITVLLRTRPSAKANGLEPRISALAGTFLIYAVVVFPRRDLSPMTEAVATGLMTIGSVGATIALSQLGRSFSIMAESRRLVTSGPYRWIRHPLYLAEEVALLGLFMQFASVWTAMIFAAQIAFQLRRIHNEELVLGASFPDYAAYQQRTARLIPGLI